jgi:signal transduction histidine kinase
MSNLGSKDALSPPESNWAVGGSLILFILSALLLLGVQGITLYDRFARASEVGLDNHVWIFSQLEVEAKNFTIALLEGMTTEGEGQPDAAHERKIRLAFDIYYSRTRTATSVAREAFEDARVRSRFELLVQSSQKLANQMDAKPRLTAQDIVALHEAFNADVPFIRKVANAAMLDSISNAEEGREARHWILGQLQLVMGLVIVLMVLSVRQAMKVTRSVSHHAAETAKVVSRLSRTLNASLDAVLIVDDDGRIKEYNAALLNILKMQAGDVITGMDVLELIAKEDRKEISQLIAMLRLDGPAGASDVSVAQRINSHIYDVNGALCPVELSCAIDHSFDGRFSYIVFIRDRSQEVAAANVLRDARDRARMDAKAKERFLSVLSHEMRTPLHGVITSLELVQLGEVKASEQGFLQTASACAKSALTQIDDVLALTRNGYLGDADEPFLPSKSLTTLSARSCRWRWSGATRSASWCKAMPSKALSSRKAAASS